MKKMSTKKGKAKPRCFVCDTEMKSVITTQNVCPKCGCRLEANRDG